jgi:hypothetical protein
MSGKFAVEFYRGKFMRRELCKSGAENQEAIIGEIDFGE